jgi:hypothetical protein
MIANNGLILSVTMLIGIHYHLYFFDTKKYTRINYGIVLALVLTAIGLYYAGWLNDVTRFLGSYYGSAPGALAATLLWIGLSFLSAVIFFRRRCYLM